MKDVFGEGRDRMVVGFTTTCAISAYYHWRCEFEYGPGDVYSIQHYVIKFIIDLQQASSFLPPIKMTVTT